MAYEKKDNSGVLFANKDRKSDKHPQATGNATIDGVDYFVDAWTNQDRNGNRYQALKFKRKDKQDGGGHSEPDNRPSPEDDKDFPF